MYTHEYRRGTHSGVDWLGCGIYTSHLCWVTPDCSPKCMWQCLRQGRRALLTACCQWHLIMSNISFAPFGGSAEWYLTGFIPTSFSIFHVYCHFSSLVLSCPTLLSCFFWVACLLPSDPYSQDTKMLSHTNILNISYLCLFFFMAFLNHFLNRNDYL